MTITHAHVSSGTNAGTGDVHKEEWNADHVIAGVDGSSLVLLAETVLSADAADITFTGLSQGYKDLVVVAFARSTRSGNAIDDLYAQVGNGSIDTTSSNYANFVNYSGTGSGSVNTGVGLYFGVCAAATLTSSYFSAHVMEILDYTNAGKARTELVRAQVIDGSIAYHSDGGGLWKNTSQAIDRIKVYAAAGNLLAGTKVAVYGRGAAIVQAGYGGRYPVQEKAVASASTNSQAGTLGATPTQGNVIILMSESEGSTNITSITQTNVTWTKVAESTASTAPHCEIWKGVVGASPGTSITVAYSGTAFCGWTAMEWSGIDGTLDQSAVATNVSQGSYIPTITPTVSDALVISGGAETTWGGDFSTFIGPHLLPCATRVGGDTNYAVAWGFPGLNAVVGKWPNGHGGTSSFVTVSLT